MPIKCVHCGEEHDEAARFCAATGRPIDRVPPPPLPPPPPPPLPSMAAPPPPPAPSATIVPDKGVFDLLKEAVELYRKHARAFLITAGVLFVPASFINSCAVSAVTGPVVRAHGVVLEPSFFLGMAGWAVTALILYGFVLPLTGGALTIAVADRILGGNATWREHWMLLFRRVGTLLTAVVPAALLVMVGFFCLVIPGIILSFCFTFVAPVALIEGIGGTDALKRSYELVKSDWLRTALMLVVFGILNAVAHRIAELFIPSGSVFFGTFLGDVLLLVVMPVPIIGSVLLYFDLRRKRDGFTDDKLRAELESLRS